MERTIKIVRRSIHIFLTNYHHFTFSVALLVLPVSISVLLSQALLPSMSPLTMTIHARLQSLFEAAGFPVSSQLFSLLKIKISQTICSSIFTLPFSLSFLLLAKSSIIQSLSPQKTPIFSSLLATYLCNSFVILSANASAFFLFFLGFNSLDALGFSPNNYLVFVLAAGALVYSVILANTFITCNLALILAGMENCGSGYLAILKACVLIKGRTSTALSLALPLNSCLAAFEALFQYRVVRAYRLSDKLTSSIVFEALLVAYLYSLLIIIDTIATCVFYKSCKSSSRIDQGYYRIEFDEEEDDYGVFTNSKIVHELP